MARRPRKLQPAELTLNFPLNGTGSFKDDYIDLSQCLSLLNRKFYRQGYEYAIQSVELISAFTSNVSVYRISRSWPIVNAWVKTMALWKKQQDETMEQIGAEDTVGRYRDFKVAMDDSHVTANNLLPVNVGSFAQMQAVSPTVAYEWNYAEVVVPNDAAPGNTVEMPLHWIGADVAGAGTSKSMVKAYAESRARPQQTDPNIVDIPLGGLFGEMFDVGDDDYNIITIAQEDNNQAPYYNDIDPSGIEFYPGGQGSGLGVDGMGTTAEYALSTLATGRFISSYGGSSIIPAGLLRVNSKLASEETAVLKIVLAPGNYKGVMARPIQDVN